MKSISFPFVALVSVAAVSADMIIAPAQKASAETAALGDAHPYGLAYLTASIAPPYVTFKPPHPYGLASLSASVAHPGVLSSEDLMTTGVTVTGYTTYCTERTVITITTCDDNKCTPTTVSVSEATTISISGECIIPTIEPSRSSAVVSSEAESTLITSKVTVTDYTTYCPESTILTITTCNDNKCNPTTVSVSEATTISISGECIIPTIEPSRSSAVVSSEAESTLITSKVTVTDYTTYCPESTILTITTCNDNKCNPTTVSVSEATTISISGECIIPTIEPSRSSAVVSSEAESTLITSKVTVTDYTTYCPESTILTITTCNDNKCNPTTVSVSEATTISISGECIIPTIEPSRSSAVVSSEAESTLITSKVTVTDYTTYCPESTILTITTCNDNKCNPTTVSVSEATTISISGECIIPTIEPSRSSAVVSSEAESTLITSKVTVTDYTTYCPESTILTITTCNDNKCNPTTVSVSEATTISISGECIIPTIEPSRSSAVVSSEAESTLITSKVTVTDYTTYCPESTILTITTCNDNKCNPTTVSVSEATTISISGECIIPTIEPSRSSAVVSSEAESTLITSKVTVTDYTTYCPESTILTITTCNDNKCNPTTVSVSEATTISISGECIIPTIEPSRSSAVVSSEAESTLITSKVTVTDYTTYCPESTILTITTCNDNKCNPTTVSVSEATTISISGECIIPTIEPSRSSAVVSSEAESTLITSKVTVTDYTTYCPESTILTITTCNDNKCNPTTVSVTSATTLTVTGECVISSTMTTSILTSSVTKVTSVPVPEPSDSQRSHSSVKSDSISSSKTTVEPTSSVTKVTSVPVPEPSDSQRSQHSSVKSDSISSSKTTVEPTTFVTTVISVTSTEPINSHTLYSSLTSNSTTSLKTTMSSFSIPEGGAGRAAVGAAGLVGVLALLI